MKKAMKVNKMVLERMVKMLDTIDEQLNEIEHLRMALTSARSSAEFWEDSFKSIKAEYEEIIRKMKEENSKKETEAE